MKKIIQGQDIILQPTIHKSTLIWLHGMGDTAFGWIDVFLTQNPFPQTTKVILPTAPLRKMAISPGFPLNAWFSMNSIEFQHDLDAFIDRNTIIDSQTIIKKLLDSEIKIVGEQNVYLGGFSQGGSMATLVGLQYKLGGVISLVGPLLPLVNKEDYGNCKVFSRVGIHDEMIPIEFQRMSWKQMAQLKNVNYKEEECGHCLTINMLNELKEWL